MLLQYMEEEPLKEWTTSTLNECYCKARKRFDSDDEFYRHSLEKVCQLQSGDPVLMEKWLRICNISAEAYREIYRRLNITLNDQGESFYRSMIPEMLEELD